MQAIHQMGVTRVLMGRFLTHGLYPLAHRSIHWGPLHSDSSVHYVQTEDSRDYAYSHADAHQTKY